MSDYLSLANSNNSKNDELALTSYIYIDSNFVLKLLFLRLFNFKISYLAKINTAIASYCRQTTLRLC